MATDYTVIQPVRQRFGDNITSNWADKGRDSHELLRELEAPFVGNFKDFPFSCPSIDRSEFGVLQFNSLGVSSWDNVIQVNGVDVPGGIKGGPSSWGDDPRPAVWNTQSLLVEPGVLAEQNVLHIASAPDPSGKTRDDFIIDNIVIWFKTRTAKPPSQPPSRGE